MPDCSGGDVRRPMTIHGTAQNKERDMCLGQGDGRGWGHDVLLYLMLFLPLLGNYFRGFELQINTPV